MTWDDVDENNPYRNKRNVGDDDRFMYKQHALMQWIKGTRANRESEGDLVKKCIQILQDICLPKVASAIETAFQKGKELQLEKDS